MKILSTLTLVLTILISTLNSLAQTYKPSNDYDTGLSGFEDVYGNKKDMKYKSATLVDEENPQYTIVSYAKSKDEEPLFGIVDNNTLKVVIPIIHKDISITGKIIHIKDEKESEDIHEFYRTDLKKIIPQPIKGNAFDVDTQNNFITFIDKDEKRGVIDITGITVIPFTKDNAHIIILDGGYFAVETDEKSLSDYNTCIMDTQAKIIIPKKHNVYYERFRNGYFLFYANQVDNSKIYSIIDLNGKDVLTAPKGQSLTLSSEPEVSDCRLFGTSKSVGDDYQYSFYSKTGELLVPFYNDVTLFTCSLFRVGQGKDLGTRKNGVYSTETKKIIIPLNYWSIDFVKGENKIKAYPIKSDYNNFELFDLKGNKLK